MLTQGNAQEHPSPTTIKIPHNNNNKNHKQQGKAKVGFYESCDGLAL